MVEVQIDPNAEPAKTTLRILANIEEELQRNPHAPHLQSFARFIKNQEQRMRKSTTEQVDAPVNFEEGYLALEKGVHAGIFDPDILAKFQVNAVAVLQSLSSEICKVIGLPSYASETLQKSAVSRSPLSFEDAYLALERGVNARILRPEVLAEFQMRPAEVIKSLSDRTRQVLGIPRL